MTYSYEKLMKEENLKFEELPKDAQIGITSIKKIEKVINMTEKKGRKVSASVSDKVKANDKWVTREILDYIEGKESKTNVEPTIPNKVEEVVEEIKQEETAQIETAGEIDEKGLSVDKELAKLLDQNITKLSLAELKAKAPLSYGIIFDNYESDSQNGIETSYYKIIETEKEVFTITKG